MATEFFEKCSYTHREEKRVLLSFFSFFLKRRGGKETGTEVRRNKIDEAMNVKLRGRKKKLLGGVIGSTPN